MDFKKCSDQELVSSFVKGNKESMEALINRHKKNVYTYILFSVKNPEVADDLFQETFIKVINSLKKGKYIDKGKFLSWVIRIAHNLTIDYFRKEKNLNTCSNDDSEIDLFNSSKFSDDNIEDKIVDNQIESDLKKIINYLPEEQKQIVLLRHYGNMSFKEIAEYTNVSINTALGRMRYALINLRKLIVEHNINLTRF